MTDSLSSRQRILCIAGVGALAALVVFAGIPRSSQFMHVLHKTGHPLAFGSIAVLVLLFLQGDAHKDISPAWRRYAVALGIAVIIGVLTEVAQLFTNRGSSVTDVMRDALGATAALGLFSSLFDARGISQRASIRRVVLVASIVAALTALAPLIWCTAAYANREARFPIVTKIDSLLDEYFVSATGDNLTIAPVPANWAESAGEQALIVTFEKGASSGAQVTEPHPDWRGYRFVLFDITNAGDRELSVSIRIHDREHNWRYDDRFNRTVTLKPLVRQMVRVSMADIAKAPHQRTMDVSHIANVAVFVWQPKDSGQFLLHGIALE